MNLTEPYPTSPSGSNIRDQITSYLSGLVPAGLIDTGIAAAFTIATLILAALGYRHARRQTWLSGWLSGPVAVLTALLAASYGVSGLPSLVGVDPLSRDPKSLLAAVVVALLAGALVSGAAWPVAAHASAYRGSPTTLADLKDWALQGDRLYAGGGAAAGAALGWIVLGPLLSAAGAVIGLLVTAVVVTLRAPAIPAARPEHPRPPAAPPEQPRPPVVPQEHRPPHAPVAPVVSDEDW